MALICIENVKEFYTQRKKNKAWHGRNQTLISQQSPQQ